MVSSTITHGEILGITETNSAYRKYNIDKRNVVIINRQLADDQESHCGNDEVPVTAETVPLGVDKRLYQEIHSMLMKHESMWKGSLGEINVMKHRFDLKPNSRPFKSAPYRAGPNMREL